MRNASEPIARYGIYSFGKETLTKTLYFKCLRIYNKAKTMGRPPLSDELRRSKLFPLRLTPNEIAVLETASRKLGETVADILRKGAVLYMRKRDKGGKSQKRKEQKR